MSGLGIRLYTDEDVDTRLAEQLRRRGYDAISCREVGNHNQALSDEWQLNWATSQERAILVYNIPHYMELDAAWKSQRRAHSGIIMAQHRWPFSELVRRTIRHLDTVPIAEQHDIIRYLET
jgi:hypothetical protein